jgi:hypothetical protein
VRAAARDRLQAAIDAHRAENGDGLDEHGHKVLDRLASDERAPDAFVAVLPNGDRWNVLLSDCITANERARSHAKRICALRKQLQKAPRATKAVETIADFFDGIRSEPFDPVKQALGTLRAEINFRRRLAEEDLGNLSRKKDASAARAQGTGWLRESVLRLSGRPNQKHVIVLAQIVLETRDIDLKNVRKAVMPMTRCITKESLSQKT